MKIKKIFIQNFRLLEDLSINIEEDLTLIVGKNNTGKTSFFEAINMFFNEKNNFSFHDFSQSTYEKFEECFKIFEKLQEDNNDEEKDKLNTCLIASMPFIQIEVWLEYDKEKDSLINISEFISDLDDKLNIVKIKLKYKSKDSKKIFSLFEVRKDKSQKLIEWLNENITSFYDIKCYGGDNLIEDNLKRKLFSVLCFENIQASRKLDDTKNDRNRTLAVGFSDYYREMNKENNQDIDKLKDQLKLTSDDLKKKYSDILKTLLQKLKSFGVEPYLTIPEINIEANFDPENILKNNIRYFYKQNDINLPENYNGLGYSNLIYLVLKVVSFIEKFKKAAPLNKSETLTILIEEPEAHLHPQMQQVFISQIQQTIKDARTDNLAVQVIISTHSSHIINEAGINIDRSFKRIRYFLKLNDKTKERVVIKDFNEFRKEDDNNDETFRFLKQYMTLNKCDIFFADKLILVEGSTERILLPLMINKVAEKLNNEYVSIIEVGGSYTVKFKELLKFINTKSLIITDIDSVIGVEKENKNGKIIKKKQTCPTSESKSETSNHTLLNWLPKKTLISDLIDCNEEDKFDSELIRVAYQIKEESSKYVARSLEEAILNVNKSFFIAHKDKFKIRNKKLCNDLKYNPYKLAPKSKEKINFTFGLMTINEDWKVPKYIEEGLIWLSKNENNK
jgi:predicted ATP-dependent endonuclease of OLD family